MNVLPFITACILAVICLFGPRVLLAAIGIAVLFGFPALQPTAGLRSAVYVQELVIAAGLLMWMFRGRDSLVTPVLPNMKAHLVIITAYIVFITAIGYLKLGLLSEAVIRSSLAGLRFGAMALVFIIASSEPLTEDRFVSILRFFYAGLLGFLVLAFLQALGVVELGAYGEAFEEAGVGAGFGAFNRISTGTIAQYGFFITLLLLSMRRLSLFIAIPAITGFLWLVLASLSRTNVFSLAVFATALVLLQKGSRIRNFLLVGLIICVGAIILLNTPAIAARMATIASVEETKLVLGTGGRTFGWLRAIRYLLVHPLTSLFGVGFDVWPRVIEPISGLHAGHNVYLHIWGELGLIGGVIYLVFFFRLTLKFWQAMRAGGQTGKLGGLAFCLMISFYFGCLGADILYPTITMISIMHVHMFVFGLLIGRFRHPSAWVSDSEMDEYYGFLSEEASSEQESLEYAY